jgi:hypothetical protein
MALVGVAVWIAGVLIVRPSLFDVGWAHAILLLAALVLVPLALRLVTPPEDRLLRVAQSIQFPAAIMLAAAYLLPPGVAAAGLSLGWFAVVALVAVHGLCRLRRPLQTPIHVASIAAGLIYVSIGGGWTVTDRFGIRPLDFDAVIVLLTAIHFHYAGFVLPIVSGLITHHDGGRAARAASIAVIAAVPLVAIGITATQLGFTPLVECVAAWVLAITGMAVGCLQIRLAMQLGLPRFVRACWTIAGTSLLVSMLLAALYGSRFYLAVDWLDIPWMRALHGTANAVGFGVVGLLGWSMANRHT